MQIITLEGIDGSGKTSIYEKLKNEFAGDSLVEFIKSPLAPFSNMIGDFWGSNKLDRFTFFVTANSHFSKTIRKNPNRVYVLDRFSFSTYVTHIAGTAHDQQELMERLITQVDIELPTKVFLIKTSLPTIEKRLEKRNNKIDNKLKADKKYFDMLYQTYYQKPIVSFGPLEVLINEIQNDFQKNVERIREEILVCKKHLSLG